MSDIDTMEAGWELDVVVAVEVEKWKWMRYFDLDYQSPDGPLRRTLVDPSERWLEPPEYVECDLTDSRQRELSPSYHGPAWSCDIAAAWELVQWVRQQDEATRGMFHHALIGQRDQWDYTQTIRKSVAYWLMLNADLPLAICRAALKAVRAGKGK
jgi:hypothetical protein